MVLAWSYGTGRLELVGGAGAKSKLDVESFQEGLAVVSCSGQKIGPETGSRGVRRPARPEAGHQSIHCGTTQSRWPQKALVPKS